MPTDFPEVPYPRAGADLHNSEYVHLESRNKTMEDIMKQLADPKVRRIGVYGPGGVGKTTLINEVGTRTEEDKLFDKVVKVLITTKPNLEKIQNDIAKQLGLNFEGESENGRAVLLRKRLEREKGNILVILDDLWDGLDLSKLGISFDGDDLGNTGVKDRKDDDCNMVKNEDSQVAYKGCKILLTSRFKEVLSNKMNVKENSIFCVVALEYEEAKTLFKELIGISDKHSEIIEEIVKCCEGLPMAIGIVGKALRNKSVLVWKDALEKLKRHELMGVQKYMEISVRVSYDQLESEELKSIFLLCAQMGPQPLVWDLVKYCFGLGLLEGVHTLTDARVRVSDLIQNLKHSSLLLDGNSSDQFNMHDIVRDAALSIAYKDRNVFILRNGTLEVWPDKIERCTVISIYKSDIVDKLPKVMNCPQLRVFHIDSNNPNLKIPDRFFARMKKLKVLILSGINLPSLPSSIQCLSDLRMLCLERCVLGNLSIIRDLERLRILSFSGSKIAEWPAEMGGWSKLQLLDISDCSIRNSIPPNFISSLTNLEELYIRKSLIDMMVGGERNQSQISVLSELKHLHQLKIVDVCFRSSDVFPADLFFDQLDDYKIVIGYFKTLSIGDFKMPNKYEASRSLALQLKAGTDIHSLKGVKMLFKRVENLLLGELNGVENAFYELNLDGFPNLKSLLIIDNTDIKFIVNSREFSHPQLAFPNLVSLSLFKLTNLVEICCSPVTEASFSSLKTIKVKTCSRLKNLFSSHIAKLLINLETIDISECYNLKVIVVDEGDDKVVFHKLCSLTLQKLSSSFIGFDANNMDRQERSNEEIESVNSISLFGGKVEIPNLESLELFSINICTIWNAKSSSSCSQNLTKLILTNCQNLTYLCSLSVANGLTKLKGLFVSECHKMEKLFIAEDIDNNKFSKVCMFPKLEEIELIGMNMLKEIWPADVSAESFSSLISVSIIECNKLDKIFPSQTQMDSWYDNLYSLKVAGCSSVEVIFEIKSHPQKCPFDTKLQLIDLSYLPNLKEVWRDPEGVANFTNLQRIQVIGCGRLRYALPVSVAKCLGNLEELNVRDCDGMEEIVDAGSEPRDDPLEFPALIRMHFYWLPNIKCFSRGRHIIECPTLTHLQVNDSSELLFTTESTNEGRFAFSAEKVIPNLEYLKIGQKEAEWLKGNMGNYRMHCLKQLQLWEVSSSEILYWFLHRIPNLQRLDLSHPDYRMRELVPSGNTTPQQRLGSVLQLKDLTLRMSYMEDIGFERDPLLQRIERLVLHGCYKLINLAHPTVSFTQLTYLEVSWCPELKNLVASSTAKCLVRLTALKVIGCPALEEIVSDERNEDERVLDNINNNIVFDKLITIELQYLENLTSFCSHRKCEFMFPMLENLILRECQKMKMFSESRTTTPKLQKVIVIEDREEEGEENLYWEGDLNATIKKVFFEYKSHLELSSYPELEQVWCNKESVKENYFRNLKTLIVKNIGYLVHVIPSYLLPCFEKLEELVVRSCDAVQVIFNVNDNDLVAKAMKFRLKKLCLYGLPQLEHVWDKDPKGISGFPALQDVSINDCNGIKYLFPASVAKDLIVKLEKLEVVACERLTEIFMDDIINSEGVSISFEFHSLISLNLEELSVLKCFYPKLQKLEFPVLKELHIKKCNQIMVKWQEGEAYLEQVLVPDYQKVNLSIQNLDRFSCDIGYAVVAWKLESKEMRVSHCQQSDNIAYQALQLVPNVEKLELTDSSLKEMFSAERPKADCAGVISHPKELRITDLSNLKSIGLEHYWIHPIPENLETLEVKECPLIKNLVSGIVALSNLTDLVISDCNNMLHLFTSSTAKSLAQLKTMRISKCRSMQEIVSEEGDESDHECEEIIFKQLKKIDIKSLPKLTCFYGGRYTLCFLSLEQVFLEDCLMMKTFCPHIKIKEDSNHRLDVLIENTPGEGDINATIRKMNDAKIAEYAREAEYLSLRDKPLFQEMWLGSMSVSETWFSHLKFLIVDGCEFLSEVVPYHLLPFFKKMEQLQVRNCSNVKTIFGVKCITNHKEITIGPALLPFLFSLKILVLENLPNLESVWNEDPDGVLTVQLLEEVHVDTCKSLTSLFPKSVAKDLVKLEKLLVEHCEGLMQIVAEIESAPEGPNLKLNFPCLASLTLVDLPKLKCFLCSLHCVQLKIFRGQDTNIEDQPCVVKEVIPNMSNLLSLGQKELKMICHGHQGISFHEVKVLDLQGFNVESEELPYGFLQNVPNIEELAVSNSSSLTKLVHSSVHLSSLVRLSVYGCDEMVHLFTSSRAKSLAHLKKMEISIDVNHSKRLCPMKEMNHIMIMRLYLSSSNSCPFMIYQTLKAFTMGILP